ncbi:hypothetical protein BH11GEM1_BH11GEM1_18720 [soil metagenome]
MATVTARDVNGRSASDQFAIVACAAGLSSPTLPTTLLPYADANGLIPAQFNATIDGVSVTGTDVGGASNSITDAGATLASQEMPKTLNRT